MTSKMVSYAQNGEDVILNRVFGSQPTGFYIDIGASHPETFSVTKHFYDRGWHGINVDPLKKGIDLFVKERPRDINLNLAIASEIGTRTFYEVSDYPELSTFSDDANLRKNHEVISYPVEIITGNELFARYVNAPVDFMKIDVEGAEYEVINSIDFLKYRPKILVVEATIPNMPFPGWNKLYTTLSHGDWEGCLLSNGYLFAYFDGLNRFYVNNEYKELLDYFQVGLCLWDEFTAHSQEVYVTNLEQQTINLQRHADERMRQIDELTKLSQSLKYHADERARQIDELTKLNQSLQYHADERMRQIDELTKLKRQIDELTKLNKSLQYHADERMRQIDELTKLNKSLQK